jgi:hypothetical protein
VNGIVHGFRYWSGASPDPGKDNQYTPVDGDSGLCIHCDELIGMHYQTAEGYLFCVLEQVDGDKHG